MNNGTTFPTSRTIRLQTGKKITGQLFITWLSHRMTSIGSRAVYSVEVRRGLNNHRSLHRDFTEDSSY